MLKTMRKIAQMAACLAVAVMLVPTGILQAAEQGSTSKNTATDVMLSHGTLTGQYVTSTGQPLGDAPVRVSKAGEEIVTTTTNEKGIFQVSGLKGGVYEVATSDGLQVIRTWEANVAPPTAKRFSTVISGFAVRGQSCNTCDPCAGGFCSSDYLVGAAILLGTAALITSIIAIDKANDNDGSNNTMSP